MEQHALALKTIATGAASFLLVMLDAFWKSHVHHRAHIAAVNAHAKRNRGHHNVKLFPGESLLHFAARNGSHARVVARGVEFFLDQIFRQRLRLFATHAIDNHRVAAMAL